MFFQTRDNYLKKKKISWQNVQKAFQWAHLSLGRKNLRKREGALAWSVTWNCVSVRELPGSIGLGRHQNGEGDDPLGCHQPCSVWERERSLLVKPEVQLLSDSRISKAQEACGNSLCPVKWFGFLQPPWQLCEHALKPAPVGPQLFCRADSSGLAFCPVFLFQTLHLPLSSSVCFSSGKGM